MVFLNNCNQLAYFNSVLKLTVSHIEPTFQFNNLRDFDRGDFCIGDFKLGDFDIERL